MKLFLKIKHWQLLCIMLLPSILIESFDSEMISIWKFVGSIWLFLTYLTWLYSVGVIVHSGTINSIVIKVLYLYIIFYSIFLAFCGEIDRVDFPFWQIPIHLLTVVVVFCMMLLASKAFIFFRKQKGENNINSFSTFVAFWFFPVGIFFIQPKLNDYDSGTDIENKER